MNAPTDRPQQAPGDGLDPTRRFHCHVLEGGGLQPQTRDVIEEQPLRITVNGVPVVTLMRTPGAEAALALGFLLTEDIVGSPAEVSAVTFCRDSSLGVAGEVDVRLSGDGAMEKVRGYRHVFSSCSLCGDAWIEGFAEGRRPFERPTGRLRVADVLRLRDAMVEGQRVFKATGGAHAAALAQPPLESAVGGILVCEDMGRHNALDKAVGAAAARGLDLRRSLLLLSSRLSFEMVAKAACAGICDVAGVSAPSAAAVRLARRLGMFLAGFVRGGTITVYAGAEALLTGEV